MKSEAGDVTTKSIFWEKLLMSQVFGICRQKSRISFRVVGSNSRATLDHVQLTARDVENRSWRKLWMYTRTYGSNHLVR